jgi:16S rRNA (guanine527-N7)-methyltransferase
VKHSPETAARLAAYRDLLLRWNTRINLISEETATDIDQRHIADCAQLQPLLPPAGPIADIGSGAGLPGLVLAIMQPEREIHLVESDKRKAAFLVEASAQLKLPMLRVHACRAENAKLPPLSAITARALAPLATLLRFPSTTNPEATILRLSNIHRVQP